MENNMTDPPVGEIGEGKNCDKNNPTDPHYGDRDQGDYNASCVWIWDLGLTNEEQE